MTICEHCAQKFFKVPWKPGDSARNHHEHVDDWIESVRTACNICTILLERIRSTFHKSQGICASEDIDEKQVANSASALPGKNESDETIRTETAETVLLRWAESDLFRQGIKTPAYRAEIQDAGGNEAWILRLRPRSDLFPNQDLQNSAKQSFFVYAAHYDEVTQFSSHLEANTKSDSTFEQIAQWIQLCEREHKQCRHLHEQRPRNTWVPTRLIDVGTRGSDTLKLVETGNIADAKYDKYITLSYKWGYEATYLLEHSTLHEFMTGIELDKMPHTFRDAVLATRALGVRYLWIDALCLLQKDTQEWLREAPRMQEVYGNSFLSLAAVSADNCEQGLFRQRSATGATPSITSVNWSYPDTKCVVMRQDFWRGEVLSEPLYARGWVLQERMLAPRILHYQKRQVLWQCPDLTACEAIPTGLSTVVDDERKYELRWRQMFHRSRTSTLSVNDEADLHEVWRQAIQSYTTCDLTKPGDKLMAISGIAKKMQSEYKIPGTDRKERYFAGLWEYMFAEQLTWRVLDWRKSKLDPCEDELSYRAPSWSWASVDGIVQAPIRMSQRRDYVMKIEEGGVNVQLVDQGNSHGEVHFASLTAEVERYWPLKFFSSKQNAMKWQLTGFAAATQSWCELTIDEPSYLSPLAGDESVQILPDTTSAGYYLECRAAMITYSRDLGSYLDGSASYSGFALALRSGAAGHAPVFRRLGLIQFKNLTGSGWEALQVARETKIKLKDEVAPSSDRAKDKYVITLL